MVTHIEEIGNFYNKPVEYVKLADIAIVQRGTRVVRKDLSEAGGYPVYQNSLTPLGFYNLKNRKAYTPYVISAGAAGEIGFCETDFWAADDCITVTCDNPITSRFYYHVLLSNKNKIGSKVRKASVPRLSKEVIEELLVPVFSLEIQEKIVRVLDDYMQANLNLIECLKYDILLEQKKFEHYRITIVEKYRNVCLMPLGELGKWKGGKTPSKDVNKFWDGGTIPWITSKDMKLSVLKDTMDHITKDALDKAGMTLIPAGATAVVTRSGILKHTLPIAYIPFESTVNQDIKVLITKDGIDKKYAAYVIQAYAEDIRTKTKKAGGTVDSIDFNKFLKYEVPIPCLDVQKKLVKNMEALDMYSTEIRACMSAEILARQKQFMHYRDYLLNYSGD